MKIGVFVGSFNPVHRGHIKIVNHLLDNKYLDKVIIIPTGNYWNKQNLIDIKDRINMLKLYESDDIIIDTTLNNVSYTYEIMKNLSQKYDNLNLIIGADNIIDFDKWKNFEELLNYNLVIINREDIDVDYYLKKHDIKKHIIVNDLPKQDISSTLIRNLIEQEKYDELDNYIDRCVLNYIIKNHIYNS